MGRMKTKNSVYHMSITPRNTMFYVPRGLLSMYMFVDSRIPPASDMKGLRKKFIVFYF